MRWSSSLRAAISSLISSRRLTAGSLFTTGRLRILRAYTGRNENKSRRVHCVGLVSRPHSHIKSDEKIPNANKDCMTSVRACIEKSKYVLRCTVACKISNEGTPILQKFLISLTPLAYSKVSYPLGVFECVEVLWEVLHGRAKAGYHGGASIAPQRVLE